MLSFVFTDINGVEVKASSPVSLSINIEENVPCDDMSAVFAYFECDELCYAKVIDDNEVVFTGVVDEQQTILSEDGQYIKVLCRSMAAKLVDNESVPISYMHPTTDVIASNHLTPFGLKVDTTDNTTFYGTQTVKKGATNWQAVEDFCKNAYNTTPRVNELGELEFFRKSTDDKVVFSNDGAGIKYLKFYESIKRCEEISKVKIKVTNSDGYHSVVENEDACNRGIERQRYLNAVLTQTPVSYAKNMIKNGKAKAYSVTLECAGRHLGIFFKDAVVKGATIKDLDNLYISSIRYRLSSNKEVTTVTLKRKEV